MTKTSGLLFSCDLCVRRLQTVCSESPRGPKNPWKWRSRTENHAQSGSFSIEVDEWRPQRKAVPPLRIERCVTQVIRSLFQANAFNLSENIKEGRISLEAQIMCSWRDRGTKTRSKWFWLCCVSMSHSPLFIFLFYLTFFSFINLMRSIFPILKYFHSQKICKHLLTVLPFILSSNNKCSVSSHGKPDGARYVEMLTIM